MAIQQFNFQKHWHQVVPLLDTEEVQLALKDFWLHIQADGYVHDRDHMPDPSLPVYYGNMPIGGWDASLTKEDLDAYRPHGRCHAIATFSEAIGALLFPELTWVVIAGQFHSVAVGCTDEDSEPDYKIFLDDDYWLTPQIVMDILLSDENDGGFSAEESLSFALLEKMVGTPSLDAYESTLPGAPKSAVRGGDFLPGMRFQRSLLPPWIPLNTAAHFPAP
jgi:hypothetical protein